MNTKANPFQALVYRLEAHIARTETALANLKLQLEAAQAMAKAPQEPELPFNTPGDKPTKK